MDDTLIKCSGYFYDVEDIVANKILEYTTKYTFEELAQYFIVEYTRRNLTESYIFPDLQKFVNNVKEIGYKVVICSASKKVLLLDQLRDFNILDLFDDVIGLDNHYAASKLELAKEYVARLDIDLENSYFIGETTHDAEVGSERRSKIGTGDRSEKIRTYNYPQNRVTDHRIGFSTMQLERVMDGAIDEIIEALITEDQARKLRGE